MRVPAGYLAHGETIETVLRDFPSLTEEDLRAVRPTRGVLTCAGCLFPCYSRGMLDKDQATRDLVEHHFAIQPELNVVYRIVNDNEASPDEPIKLLEVNAATLATGSVEVFGFGPSRDLPFSVQIAEVTPGELERFRGSPQSLPRGWDLSRAEIFERPRAAE